MSVRSIVISTLIPNIGNLCLSWAICPEIYQFHWSHRTNYSYHRFSLLHLCCLHHCCLFFIIYFLLLTLSLICSLSSFLRWKFRSLIWDFSFFWYRCFSAINYPLSTALSNLLIDYVFIFMQFIFYAVQITFWFPCWFLYDSWFI